MQNMQNIKLQNFFKTLFFRGNYGYLPTVIFFWLSVLFSILTTFRHFFLCDYSLLDRVIGSITEPVYAINLFTSGFYELFKFDFNFGPEECPHFLIKFGMTSTIILYFFIFLLVFFINMIIVENIKVSKEKKASE